MLILENCQKASKYNYYQDFFVFKKMVYLIKRILLILMYLLKYFFVSLFQIYHWLKKKLINKKYFVYFATRTHKQSIVQANFFRQVLGDIGSLLKLIILNIKIKDTQCGYKLYKKTIAKLVFSKLKNQGYEHDMEIILLLKLRNIGIKELPVKWKHKKYSKVNVFWDPIKMFIGMLIIRFRYF